MELRIVDLDKFLADTPIEDVYEHREVLLVPDDALRFVHFCSENDWAVIGVEGGKIIDGAFEPHADLLNDFSRSEESQWDSFRNSCNKQAAMVIKHNLLHEDTAFYVVFGNRIDAKR